MTCKELGGACNKEFHAKTFEEISDISRKHGRDMYEKGDEPHIEAMKEMKKLMDNPEAMKEWIDVKQKKFDSLIDI